MVTKSENSNNNEQFNAGSWLLPFDNYVWLMIVVTILVSAVIYWFLEVLNPDSDQRKYQLDPIESIWLLGTYVCFFSFLFTRVAVAVFWSHSFLLLFFTERLPDSLNLIHKRAPRAS
jgi:hypothetical protein